MVVVAAGPALADPPPRRAARRAQDAGCSASSPSSWRSRFARPAVLRYARFDIAGTEHIPTSGPAIIVRQPPQSTSTRGRSAWPLARSGRTVRFLGKKEVFDAPVVGQLARAMGGIRVERGTGSDEPLKEAADALAAGELVAIMPQGTIPRGPAFFDPVLKGRWGAARLAAMTGAPVIPIGLWGTEKVWPRSARLPNCSTCGNPPEVRLRVGPPVDLGYEDLDATPGRSWRRSWSCCPPEAREQREPTAEELARTCPPGWHGRPAGETS